MIVKFGESLLKSYYQPVIDTLEKSLADAGYSNVNLDFSLSDLVGSIPLAFILSGLFLLILTIFGLGGACCKVKCMLIAYVVMLSLVLVGQIVFMIIFYAKQELVRFIFIYLLIFFILTMIGYLIAKELYIFPFDLTE